MYAFQHKRLVPEADYFRMSPRKLDMAAPATPKSGTPQFRKCNFANDSVSGATRVKPGMVVSRLQNMVSKTFKVSKEEMKAIFSVTTRLVPASGDEEFALWRCTVIINGGTSYTRASPLLEDDAKLWAALAAIRLYPWPPKVSEWHANTPIDNSNSTPSASESAKAQQKIRKRRKKGTGGAAAAKPAPVDVGHSGGHAQHYGGGGGRSKAASNAMDAEEPSVSFTADDAKTFQVSFGKEAEEPKRFYTRGQVLDVEEDMEHEFKEASDASAIRNAWHGFKIGGDAEKNVIAFLNSSKGGVLYLGVNDAGKVNGVRGFDRHGADQFRQRLTHMRKSMVPWVDPDFVKCEFVAVKDAAKDTCVVEIVVRPGLSAAQCSAYENRQGNSWVKEAASLTKMNSDMRTRLLRKYDAK